MSVIGELRDGCDHLEPDCVHKKKNGSFTVIEITTVSSAEDEERAYEDKVMKCHEPLKRRATECEVEIAYIVIVISSTGVYTNANLSDTAVDDLTYRYSMGKLMHYKVRPELKEVVETQDSKSALLKASINDLPEGNMHGSFSREHRNRAETPLTQSEKDGVKERVKDTLTQCLKEAGDDWDECLNFREVLENRMKEVDMDVDEAVKTQKKNKGQYERCCPASLHHTKESQTIQRCPT